MEIAKIFKEPAQRFTPMGLIVFVLLVLLRLYEYGAIAAAHTLPDGTFLLFMHGLLYDATFFLSLGGLAFIIFFMLSELHPGIGTGFFVAASLFVVLGDAGLIQYFVSSSVPLGADLFGYSLSDIWLTVSSSGGVSVLPIAIFIFLTGLVLSIPFLVRRFALSRTFVLAFFAVVFLSMPLQYFIKPDIRHYKTDSAYNIACSKASFFLDKTMQHLSEEQSAETSIGNQEYPVYRERHDPDVLGTFFTPLSEKPNLVFIIVEGLGRAFVGAGASYGGFTPFLDSLSTQSLYWENFLSTSGRTFCVLPSLFGSLPYGSDGFMELGKAMPAHMTLISLLKKEGYYTSFFYGGRPNFDKQDVFLERQGVDFFLDEFGFGPGYAKADTIAGGFSWGFPDGELFKRSLEVIDAQSRFPRLDVYLTLTTHEPFLFPDRERFERVFAQRLEQLNFSPEKRRQFESYKAECTGLLYTDNALREFFAAYRLRPEYANTIFFITGDHRMIPMPEDTKIDRFRVPFIIASPLLSRTKKFSSVSSHRDVTPTVLAFLRDQCTMRIPGSVHWLGDVIDTAEEFRNIHALPFMRTKNSIDDYLDNNYFLSGDQLFLIRKDLDLQPITQPDSAAGMLQKLAAFRRLNSYLCLSDKLMPANNVRTGVIDDDSLLAPILQRKLDSDQLFQIAREKAFSKEYPLARALCRHLLSQNPNYHDIRTLLGRTYAWDGNYPEATTILREVKRRAPYYMDASVALIDIEIWSSHLTHALALTDSLLRFDPTNRDLREHRTRINKSLRSE